MKIRSVQLEIWIGDRQTDKHTDHAALWTSPLPPQTRSTSFRSARFARFAALATRVIMFQIFNFISIVDFRNLLSNGGPFTTKVVEATNE